MNYLEVNKQLVLDTCQSLIGALFYIDKPTNEIYPLGLDYTFYIKSRKQLDLHHFYILPTGNGIGISIQWETGDGNKCVIILDVNIKCSDHSLLNKNKIKIGLPSNNTFCISFRTESLLHHITASWLGSNRQYEIGSFEIHCMEKKL